MSRKKFAFLDQNTGKGEKLKRSRYEYDLAVCISLGNEVEVSFVVISMPLVGITMSSKCRFICLCCQVYTINLESRYLMVQGVPAIGVMTELIQLCALYGTVEEYTPLDEYPAEEFTEVYLVKFQKLTSARCTGCVT